jgi:uncharacterized protein (TIGR03437 family)
MHLALIGFRRACLALAFPLLAAAAGGPTIASLNPSSATAGTAGFTLTISGTGFLPGATVQMGGSVLATTFVDATQLTALVPAGVIGSPGNPLVEVVNPGGIASNIFVSFTIYPPGVTIASLEPSTIGAGYPFPSLAVTVNGSGFASGAIVAWNGSALATAFVSSTQLTASVPANLIASPGTGTVTVLSGGLVSNSASFTIGPPYPVITSLNPSSAITGSGGFTLTISGTGFLPGATVQMGSVLTTTFVNTTQLTALVPAGVIGNPGNLLVEVVNPGGEASGIVNFTINPLPRLSILTASPLPPGTVGTPYSLALDATGGTAPYKGWTVAAGALPPGLSLTTLNSVLTGILSGVPTAAGTFAFTAEVTDSLNTTATTQFSLTINPGAPSISANGILNAASYAGGGVAPGEMLTIFGSGLGPGTLAGLQLDSRGYVSTALAGTQVLFDGTPAPLIYALAGQVSAMAPYAINGKSSTQVQVVFQGQASNTVSVPVVPTIPGIFTLDSSGSGPGAIVNQDGTVNSANNPAPAGSIVFLYATGEGETNPGGIDGKPGDNPAPTPVAQPVTAAIGGLNASVLYAGGVPGLVAGLLQVNIQVPSDVSAGNAVPVVLTIGGKTTQANVTLAVGPPAR